MKTLTWVDLRALGKTDNGNRWYPIAEISAYFDHIRAPSRAWPNSYAKAAMTAKFAAWLLATRPELAAKLGLSA